MSTQDINARDRTPAFYIKIEGLPCFYGTVMPPEFIEPLNIGSQTYERRASIIPGKGFEFGRALQSEDAIIEAEPVEVFLVSDPDSDDAYDPGTIFGRLGFQSADALTQLKTDIKPEDDALGVAVSNASMFSEGDVVHIGREAIQVTGVNYVTSRLSLGQRGVFGTRKQAHRVDAESGLFPSITMPAVHWRGRRATVYECALGVNGERVSAWVERFKGVIATEPSIAADGRAQTVKIEIAPLSSLLDAKLGTGRGVLRLADGVHTFDGENVSSFDVAFRVPQRRYVNSSVLDIEDDADEVNASFILGDKDNISRFDGLLDLTLPTGHPRKGVFSFSSNDDPTIDGERLIVTGTKTVEVEGAPDEEFISYSSSAPAATLIAEGRAGIHNFELCERKRVYFHDGDEPSTKAWPQALVDGLESSLSTGSVNGIQGSFLDVSVDFFSEVAPAFAVRANFIDSPMSSWFLQPEPGACEIFLSNDCEAMIQASFVRVNDGSHFYPYIWGADGVIPGREFFRNVHPHKDIIDLGGDSDEGVQTALVTVDEPAVLPTRIANAFYSLGNIQEVDGVTTLVGFEKYITLNRDPGMVNGNPLGIEISADKEDEPLARVVIDEVTEENVPGVGIVYRCRVIESESYNVEEVQVIADHSGSPKHRLRVTPHFDSVTIGELLLQLLCSMDGAGVTSATYDVLPFGAGISEEDIDVESFLAIPSPSERGITLKPIVREGSTVYECVQGLLRASGFAIDMRVDGEGSCRLHATPFGIPNAVEALDTFTEADIADSPVPASIAEAAIRNVFDFSSNFDTKGEAQLEKSVRDTVSIEAFGEESKLAIEMQGAIIEDDTPGQVIESLRPIFSRLRMEFSFPRRVFDVTLRAGVAAGLKVGGTYLLTHRLLRGVSGLGVTNAPCRLRSVSSSGFEASARCEFVFYGIEGSGWGPSADVSNIAGNVLTLDDRRYSPERHFQSGAELFDVDGFLYAGASIRLHPSGDMDSYEIHTIQSFDRNARTVTLQDAPGIGAPAFGTTWANLAPSNFPGAPEQHKPYGYISITKVT